MVPAPGDPRSIAHQREVARRHRGSRPEGDEPEGVAGGAVALVEGGPLMARRRRPEGVTFADMPAHLRRFVPEAWLERVSLHPIRIRVGGCLLSLAWSP